VIILLIHGRQNHIDSVVNCVVYVIHGILVYYKDKTTIDYKSCYFREWWIKHI